MPIHPAAVSGLIARNPNSTKKPNIASAVAVIWIAWENTATRPMLKRWRSDGRSTARDVVVRRRRRRARSRRARPASPRTSAATSAQLANVFWARISAGSRDSRKTLPSRKNTARTTTYDGPYSVPATCQTSALTNRNVMNSNSNGRARERSG